MRPVGIGLAGLGRWGRNYLKTLADLPECRLVAVADSEPTALAAVDLFGGTKYDSASQLLADRAVEAVIIAAPDRTHSVLAAAALEAGRDVLVEKPMALTPAEAAALREQAEAGNRVLAVGHTAAYQAGLAELVAEVTGWPPETDRRATAVRTSSGYADGRSTPILDLCPHDLALAVLLFGPPAEARARAYATRVEYEVRFAHGALLSGRAEWHQPPHVRSFVVDGSGHAFDGTSGGSQTSDLRETPLARQCLDFIECCRTRRQPLSDGWLGLNVVRCLSALTLSARDSGTWVRLAEQRTAASACPGADRRTHPLELGART